MGAHPRVVHRTCDGRVMGGRNSYPKMNIGQLKACARSKLCVRWFPSQIVEMLELREGNVWAVNLVTKLEHRIWPRDLYWCQVVEDREIVQVGDLVGESKWKN